LDWQIQRLLDSHDLSQANQFQDATHKITALLGKLPSAALRSHYIHHCAELLGLGDTRHTLRLEESLRQQVRGQRWHGQGQKWQRPADTTLREAAEAQLLRIYLHLPEQRAKIRAVLQQRDLEFSFSHHRFLWRQILEIEETAFAGLPAPDDPYGAEWLPVNHDLDLIAAVQDLCTEFSTELHQIWNLLQLNEKTGLDLHRPTLMIQAAAASLERIKIEKRCRHLLESIKENIGLILQESLGGDALRLYLENLLESPEQACQDVPGVDFDRLQGLDSLRQEYYRERRRLYQLDQQRCPDWSDLIAANQVMTENQD
jgi:DNA primase